MADKRIFDLTEEGFLDDLTDKVYMWLDKKANEGELQEPSWKFKANVFLKILNNFATKFVPNVATVEGKCYWHGGDLFMCNVAYTGDWVPSNFTLTSVDELFARKDVLSALTTYAQNVASSIATPFDPTRPNDEGGYAYYAGTTVMYNGLSYVFNVNHKSGEWNPNEIEQKPLSESVNLEGVGEAVNEWLNEHPEATTTVQDDSLTELKFTNTLKKKTIKDYVTPEMFGAKGDGVTDDTTAIQSALDAHSVVVFSCKTYLVTASVDYGAILLLNEGQRVLLGRATIKLAATSFEGYDIFKANGASNIVIQGGTIVGDRDDHTGATGEYGHGIRLINSSNSVIDGVKVYKCWGDGIVVTDANDTITENVVISNCYIEKCRRNGITIGGGNNILITHCTIKYIDGTAPKAGIDIEPNSNQDCSNVRIEYCYTEGSDLGLLASMSIDQGIIKTNISVTHCTSLESCSFYGCDNLVIDDLTCWWLNITRYTKGAKIVNSKFERVLMYRQTSATFENCDIVSSTDIPIYFYTSGATGMVEYAKFINCRIKTTSGSCIFRNNENAGGLTGDISFEGCDIEGDTDVMLTLYIHGNLSFKNCSIKKVKGFYGCLLSFHEDTDEKSKIVISNCLIQPLETIYLIDFQKDKTKTVDVFISNSEINKMNRFMNIRDGATAKGTVKLFSNMLMDTSLADYDYNLGTDATDSLTKFGNGSVFTTIS